MRSAVCTWIDPHAPLITTKRYDEWVQTVKECFPSLWAQFSKLRGIKHKQLKGKEQLPGKERQVFHQIMVNFRHHNPRCMLWWAMESR